jgi:cell shape-determining protein MreC
MKSDVDKALDTMAGIFRLGVTAMELKLELANKEARIKELEEENKRLKEMIKL